MKPFFSIIIPTLNEEKFLPRLLNDLVKQKVKNFEVIVIDGKSIDNTKEIVKSFFTRINIKLINAKKSNLSFQKNIGGKIAKGNYLIFLDADMSINSFYTKTAEKYIKKNKGIVFLPQVYPEEKLEFPEIDFVFPIVNTLVDISQKFNKPFSSGPSMIWEKGMFNLIGGFDDLFGEDHYIIRKANYWGIRAKCIPSLKVSFSLRRMKKQGRLDLIYHFIRSHIYLLFNDKLKEKWFKYEMGGQLYTKNFIKKRDKNFLNNLKSKNIVNKIKKSFNLIIKEI